MRARSVLAAGLLALAAGGCSTFSSASDWSAYRATRVAPSLENRLAAAQRYLADRPDGVFRADVRAWFDHAEEIYFTSKKGSVTGLHAYLKALPRGPHAGAADSRIAELEHVERSRRAELDKSAAEVEARVAGPAAVARVHVRKELDDWLARFLDDTLFQAPFSRARAELIVPFSLSLPSPHCAALDAPVHSATRRCSKLLELPYEVDGPTGPEPREATLEVSVLEDPFGVPVEVTVGGPDLFLRLEETYRVKPIAPDEPGQRAVGGARAAVFVNRAFSSTVGVSDPRACVRPILPPVALRLQCEGLHVEVLPATAPGEDDRIVIAPAGAAR